MMVIEPKHVGAVLFFGPCIFNNEDEKINQKNAQINSGLILLLINHSNMFRPLSRSHHQGVRNPLGVAKPLY